MDQMYWINARDKLGFLASIMRELSGERSQLILEGDLSPFDFSSVEQCAIPDEYRCDADTEVISLRLNEDSIKEILKQIQPNAGYMNDVRHLQIRVGDELQLLIGDNFHNECISVGPRVSLDFLSGLKALGIVRSIQTDEQARESFR